MDIEELQRRIRDFADKDCGAGATPEQVAEAERQLRVTFPPTYRGFLREFGWARFSHQELYGLGRDVPRHLDLLRNTLSERDGMRPALPPSLVPIMSDGAGNHYCLATSEVSGGACPVVIWNHELGEDQQPQVASPTFETWLVDLLDRLGAATWRADQD
jgi:cell wall assembly regulator SMI1